MFQLELPQCIAEQYLFYRNNMEQLTYSNGDLGFRNHVYKYINYEAIGELQLILELKNDNNSIQYICFEAGDVEINGVIQETQQQMIDTLNGQS
jgi:hypothetical protein